VKTQPKSDLYRLLPSVDDLLREKAVASLVEAQGQPATVEAIRVVLAKVREEIAGGHLTSEEGVQLAIAGLPDGISRQLDHAMQFSLRPAINATGVILHTNLGRAPLSASALKRITEVAGSYSNLEFDIAAGERGKRDVHVERLFSRLLNHEGVSGIRTVVVNNCAAAVMLALNTLAEGGEVIVSRGELVEIGGSFRVPDVMAKSGAVLREVGTTNRTRIADYERAIHEKTRLLLRVHRSNFAIVGFTEQPSLEELAALGRKHNLPVMEDLGGGALLTLRSLGVNESGVMDSLRAGVDLVTYSGDKMLGGPQAGLLSGREELIRKIRSNPLFRALRVDKLTYAALEATLMEYIRQNYDAIPFARMMRLSAEEIRRRAENIGEGLKSNRRLRVEIMPGESLVGGGSAPTSTLPTFLLAITAESLSADEVSARLRAHNPPVIARVEEGRVLLDLRTVFDQEHLEVIKALLAAVEESGHPTPARATPARAGDPGHRVVGPSGH
jgi:L-seryl-tRNA(Ser) seleniumtransferase